MKVLGRYVKEFYTNHFPENHYYDEEGCDLQILSDESDENWFIEDDAIYNLAKAGWVVHEETGKSVKLSTAFAKWWKQRTVETIIVEVPKERADEVRSHLRSFGYKVLQGIKI